MNLSDNDHAVIEAVQLLGQVTAAQLTRLCFPHLSLASEGRGARRVLKRLHDAGYIDRLGERVVGKALGGSDGYIYVPARSKASRIEPHTLDIGEFYICLTEAERAGKLKVLEYSPTEQIKGSRVRSDAYLWLEAGGRRSDWYIEIDRGTESKDDIRLKAKAYTTAAKRYGEFPRVLYVVTFAPRGRLTERAAVIDGVARQQEFPEQFEVCALVDAIESLCQ